MALLELLVVALGAYFWGDTVGYRRGVKEGVEKLGPGVHALRKAADQQLRLIRRDRP